MRSETRMELDRYGEIAKRQTKAKNSKDLNRATMAQYDLADELAKYYEMPIGTQLKIFELQKKKQAVMEWLKDELKKLDIKDNLVELQPGSRWVFYQDGQLIWRSGDRETVVTFGELLTDLDWGVNYAFDSAVPRKIRKQYLVATAKHRLKGLLDEQIMRQESAGEKDEGKRKAYESMLREKDAEKLGTVAETMLRNFMARLTIDHGLTFTIEEPDPYQDVQQKIDFIICRPTHLRGVRVDKNDNDRLTVGIQFTMDNSWEANVRKNRQLNRVRRENRLENIDDMVLVEMNLNNVVFDALEQWKKTRTPGGPDQNLPPHIKHDIFFKLLNGLYSDDEIQKMWAEIEPKISQQKIADQAA
ncbi:MAG: hypothetical protein V1664_02465 [Candidatus Uhrbacteria bacterium]